MHAESVNMIFFEEFGKEVVDDAASGDAVEVREFFGSDANDKVAAVAFFVFEGDLVGGICEVGAESGVDLFGECHGESLKP